MSIFDMQSILISSRLAVCKKHITRKERFATWHCQTFPVNCLICKAVFQGKYNDMVGENTMELLSV